VTRQGAGFDVDTNIATFFRSDGTKTDLPQMSKLDLATRILDEIAACRAARPRC